MNLTAPIVREVYSMLRRCKPFSGWSALPEPDAVRFIVDSGENMGTYLYHEEDDTQTYQHVITVSRDRCGHLDTVIKTVAHEMIHCRRHKTNKWAEHDAIFRRYAKQIATELGFDPLEL